jgi:small subunit ribosomal protein S11
MHREAARRLITPPVCARSCPFSSSSQKFSPFTRPFSHTPQRRSNKKPEDASRSQPKSPTRETAAESIASILSNSPTPSSAEKLGPIASGHLGSLSRLFSQNQAARKDNANKPTASTPEPSILDYGISSLNPDSRLLAVEPPHHLHVYAHKHNTHVTLTRPNRDAIISVSTGNIGFRKAARSTYDAAYQLAAYVLGKIQEQGLIRQIKELEVVLRGYGAGREACTKVLLGSEGRFIRSKIVRVTDATRLKFGGTRSKKPRRLG